MLGYLVVLATLRFQPTKRPQISSQKPKPTQSKALLNPAISSQPSQAAPSPDANESTQRSAPKTTIADWTGDGDEDDVNGFYGEKRQRGGRKKRKKNKEESHLPQNWDDIYDPSRPNNYEEYKNSDEKIREVREWKDKLYAHRMATRRDDYSDSDDERPRMQMNRKCEPSFVKRAQLRQFDQDQFAPPSMSFAPPPSLNNAPAAPPAVDVPDDATGEDAYARRLRLSQQQDPSPTSATESASFVPPVSAPSISPLPSPPPPPPYTTSNTTSVQATQASSTISRAPVRYNLPAPPPDIPRSEDELANVIQQEEQASEEEKVDEDTPRSSRPGQKGFAERLMSKYGWTKGTGLGAKGSGIINPLRVQVEKQKKKPNSEGGGFAGPGGRGKIVGGKKVATGEPEGGKFGPMSEVVILRNMMEGMDIEQELGEGNLMQEIGEECGAKVALIATIQWAKLIFFIVRESRKSFYRSKQPNKCPCFC